jgi:hypothetical protein
MNFLVQFSCSSRQLICGGNSELWLPLGVEEWDWGRVGRSTREHSGVSSGVLIVGVALTGNLLDFSLGFMSKCPQI